MISYFKYTAGESFTLNGRDYTGFFNVQNGSAFVGKVPTPTAPLLDIKDTMLTNAYLAKKEFDRTAAPVQVSDIVSPPEISPRNVIDQTFLDRNLGILNNNNLNLYSSNLTSNLNLVNFQDSFTDNTSYFLGVSAGFTDTKDSDTKLAKDNNHALQIVPFSHTNELTLGISNLDNTVDSALIVNGDKSFKYLTTTTAGSQTLSGTFAKNGSLKSIKQGEFEAASALLYNDHAKILYNVVQMTDNNFTPFGNMDEEIELLPDQVAQSNELAMKRDQLQVRSDLADGSRPSTFDTPEEATDVAALIGCGGYHAHDGEGGYMPCLTMESFMSLTDLSTIQLEIKEVNKEAAELGQVAETYCIKVYDANSYITTGNLQLKDKITIEEIITDGKIRIGNTLKGYIIGAGGRKQIVLSEISSSEIFGIVNTVSNSEQIIAFDINDVDDSIIVVTSVDGICDTLNLYRLDSENLQDLDPNNTFFAPQDETSYRRDHPELTTPVAGFVGYIVRYQKSSANYNLCPVHNISIKFSSYDSNVFVLTDNGNVITSFISNPGGPASFGSRDSLLYPRENKWGEFNQKPESSQLKWNTNNLPSNYFNNINFLYGEYEGEIYTLLHNIGRIYLSCSKQLLYNNFVPLDLVHNYNKGIGVESSLGISLNSELQAIIKDALNIFYNVNIIPVPKVIDGVSVLGGYTSPKDIPINFRDLEFHENEEVNYNTVWRVFSKIYEFQKSIMNRVINPPTDEITAVTSMTVNYLDSNGNVIEVQHNDDGTAVVRDINNIREEGM
jgi:hypothetical protein